MTIKIWLQQTRNDQPSEMPNTDRENEVIDNLEQAGFEINDEGEYLVPEERYREFDDIVANVFHIDRVK